MTESTTPASARPSRAAVSLETVEATISALTEIDETGDKRTMGRMARRLGKEQPALLRRAATLKEQHGDAIARRASSTARWCGPSSIATPIAHRA